MGNKKSVAGDDMAAAEMQLKAVTPLSPPSKTGQNGSSVPPDSKHGETEGSRNRRVATDDSREAACSLSTEATIVGLRVTATQSRIQRLVELNQPMLANDLPMLYEEEYHERLSHAALGFESMNRLVESNPSVLFHRPAGDDGPLYLVLPSNPLLAQQQERNPSPAKMLIVQTRVKWLVRQHDPLDMRNISQLYEKEYSEKLECAELGYQCLGDLIDAIPAIEQRTQAGTPMLTIRKGELTVPYASDDLLEEVDWLAPAVELWVGRALRGIERVNADNNGEPMCLENFEVRLAMEAKSSKKLRPNGVPVAKEYVKKVVEALRLDPRLRWEKKENCGIVYWATGCGQAQEFLDIVPSTENEKEFSDDLGTVQSRIRRLAETNYPLLVDDLRLLYYQDYSESLNNHALGFETLKSLLESTPSVLLHRPAEVEGPLFVISRTSPTFAGAIGLDNDRQHLVNTVGLTENTERGRDGIDSASSMTSEPLSLDLDTVKQRIEKMAELRYPMNLAKLPQLYKEDFGETLDYRAFGYVKLKGLVEAIPAVMVDTPSGIAPNLLVPKKRRISQAKERIESLAKSNRPLDPCDLPRLYKEKYREELNYKSLGFGKLKALIATIPSLRLRAHAGRPSCIFVFPIKGREDTNEPSHEASAQKATLTVGAQISSPTKESTSTDPTDPSDCSNNAAMEIQDENQFSDAELIVSSCTTLAKIGPSVAPTSVQSVSEVTARGEEQERPHLETPHQKSTKGAEDQQFSPSEGKMPPFVERPSLTPSTSSYQRAILGDQSAACSFQEMALFGQVSSQNDDSVSPVFLNLHEPFCLTAVGVQGAGKSHTLACVLESCLLPVTDAAEVSRLQKPMTALVLHYDQNAISVCEAAGLLSHSVSNPHGATVASSKATILVSPAFYKQRKAFYEDYCDVRPLLFKWNSLTADHIKRIMRIGSGDNQLYVASFMALLRSYQRRAVVPDFEQFITEVKEKCNVQGQQGPLDQRIALLESMVAESDLNKDIVGESMDLSKAISCGLNLIIVDLTDPLLSKDEANGLFQVVTEQFRSIPLLGGKLLALDEAHKFMNGIKSDGLSEAIVDAARLMRHDGMRLAVSTQSPRALAPELLELVSIAVLHQFHSQDWWTYLCHKLPLPESAWEKILSLVPGSAMVFASRPAVANESHVTQIQIRPRITADFGASRTNK